MSVLVSHTLTLGQRWLSRNRATFPPSCSCWSSHLLEDRGATQSLPGPGDACTSLLLSAALTVQGARVQQRPALLPYSWKSSIYALSPPPFSYIIFLLYNEASRDWWRSEPRYSSLGSPASIKAVKTGKGVEAVDRQAGGQSRRGPACGLSNPWIYFMVNQN